MQFLIACLRLSFPQTTPQDEEKLILHLQEILKIVKSSEDRIL